MKHKWKNHCGLSVAGADNADANSNTIFTIKGTELNVPDIELSKRFSKGFERLVYWD